MPDVLGLATVSALSCAAFNPVLCLLGSQAVLTGPIAATCWLVSSTHGLL
jgi:hypothetical protein